MKLAADAAPALEVAYQGQRVLLMPPVGGLAAEDLPAAAGPWSPGHPRGPGRPPGPQAHLARLNPGGWSSMATPAGPAAARSPWPVPCQFTREGAVSLYLDASGVTARQWRPEE